MSLTVAHLVIAAACGFCVGLIWALRIARRYKQAPVELTVTPEVLNQLNGIMVSQWLDQRGMCWMPKGPDFKVSKEMH